MIFSMLSGYWMDEDLIPIWNVADILDDDKKIKLINHTSNGLEHYNNHFNSIVPSSHPNLVVFADALCEEADNVVQRLEDIDKRKEISLEYSNPVFPRILGEFWVKINRGNNKAAGKKRRAVKRS